jgi:DNA-binding IclR family transcriptional regulator
VTRSKVGGVKEAAGNHEGSGGVQVIARVGQLFRALDGEPWGLTLTQLATRLQLPRSTVHRLVGALSAEGLLMSATTAGRVRIGAEFVRIASASRLELRQQVEPLMRQVFDAIGETVDLSVLEAEEARVVHVIPTQHQLRAISDVGVAFPLHCTSKGKALLAALSDAQVKDLLPSSLHRYTESTVTSRAQLLRELADVRESGVAFDIEEHAPGICAAAIAARDPFGVLFTISVPAPSVRFPGEREKIVRALLRVRAELNEAFETPES